MRTEQHHTAGTTATTPIAKAGKSLKTTLRALRHRNYRLYFFGQIVSLSGTWMQMIALNWLVYRLTDSPFMLGLVGFVMYAPNFFLAPFAGVLADRLNRWKMLFTAQSAAMINAFILATLMLTGIIEVWHILLLASIQGFINSFDFPSRQSMMVQLVDDKRDLSNAIALNSSMVNVARLLGPSLAGILIATVGEGICFLINGISYSAVLLSLLAMRLRPHEPGSHDRKIWRNFTEGLSYVNKAPAIRSVLILLAVIALFGFPFGSLMPIMARDILKGGPDALGFLMSASGVGAIVGAIVLASRQNVKGLERVLSGASLLIGIGLSGVALSRELSLSIGIMFFVGIGTMLQIAVSNTLLQTLVDEDKRGRVISLYVASFVGMLPFGNLISGTVASAIGAPTTMLIWGCLCIIASTIFFSRLPHWRKHGYPMIEKQIRLHSADEIDPPPPTPN